MDRSLALIREQTAEYIDLFKVTPEHVHDLAASGLSMKAIAHLMHKDHAFISKDPILQNAYNQGRALIGAKVRASIVSDALEKDNLTAKLHLDKVLNNEAQVQQVEISVKNDTLNDVPTEQLIDIMYKDGND